MGVVQDLRGTLVQETHADCLANIDFKGFFRFCLGFERRWDKWSRGVGPVQPSSAKM